MIPYLPEDLAPYLTITREGFTLKENAPKEVVRKFKKWVEELEEKEKEMVKIRGGNDDSTKS
ncbi:conserved hypothetical protein [Caldicellulosiruptor hydrothermalis 108]|uniref:Uncharacterized protein n=1 Tax=Caldicellulosiruptor hydrothermalis (strain DSM 18901 / VKM B-2411 / 108) TaxID=632292 RepID=E4QDT2_CALH1|nr:hypothetical protein [Caldicellulosiruptor hydrothermalis]ADQ06499.1 conserved hypothetical protein [Caldicellulosiruptor hydrothermalis 108]